MFWGSQIILEPPPPPSSKLLLKGPFFVANFPYMMHILYSRGEYNKRLIMVEGELSEPKYWKVPHIPKRCCNTISSSQILYRLQVSNGCRINWISIASKFHWYIAGDEITLGARFHWMMADIWSDCLAKVSDVNCKIKWSSRVQCQLQLRQSAARTAPIYHCW